MVRGLYNIFELPAVVDGVKYVTITIHVGRELFAGCIILTDLTSDRPMITHVYVHPDQRRIGLCKRMLNRAYEIAHTHGCRSVGVMVYRDNTDAINAYVAMDFKPVEDDANGQTLYLRDV